MTKNKEVSALESLRLSISKFLIEAVEVLFPLMLPLTIEAIKEME